MRESIEDWRRNLLVMDADMRAILESAMGSITKSHAAITERLAASMGALQVPIIDLQRLHVPTFEVQWGVELTRQLADLQRTFEPVLEVERVNERLLQFGIVPHPAVHPHADRIVAAEISDAPQVSQKFVADVWAALRPKLCLSLGDCLRDAKTAAMFEQLVRAHDSGLYDLVGPVVGSIIERVARLAQRNQTLRSPTAHWIENGVGDIPLTELSGAWRLYAILVDQTFANCRSDVEADALPYLNRHAAAHGFGLRLSHEVESFNCILLAHFAIKAAAAFERYTSTSSMAGASP